MNEIVPSELQIHRITDMAPRPDGSTIVLKAAGVLREARTDLEIAVTTDLAPTMALALLASTAQARSLRDELGPALDVLGAAVVRSSSPGRVRLQLLFDKGAVLPLEMSLDAALAMSEGLVDYLEAADRRYAKERSSSMPRAALE